MMEGAFAQSCCMRRYFTVVIFVFAVLFILTNMALWSAEAPAKPKLLKINKELDKSQIVAVMLSKDSVDSDWVQDEWQGKQEKARKTGGKDCVLPILVDDCELPTTLSHRNYVDFRTDYQSGLKELLETLNKYK